MWLTTVDRKQRVEYLGVYWLVLINGPARVLSMIILVGVYCAVTCSCQPPGHTDDPKSSVVKLEHELMDFAKGQTAEVTGRTEPEEAYILMYGYEASLNSLPISQTLQQRLEAIQPRPTEMYVLAHTEGDYIKEYTDWEITNQQNDHPLLWPMPFMIRGDPFKIRATKREPHSVDMKLE